MLKFRTLTNIYFNYLIQHGHSEGDKVVFKT